MLWAPPSDVRNTTKIGDFMSWLERACDLRFDGYDDLWRWSVDELDAFWRAVAEWSGVLWHSVPSTALADSRMPGARWFPDATLNYAEHALRAASLDPDGLAVIGRSQTRAAHDLTWAELTDAVARCRAGLQRLGVRPGDRVAAFMPNIPETTIAFLATASLGAIWSSCAPEFGVRSVIDRLAQIEPVVLLAVDGYRYGEKAIDKRADVAAIEAALTSLRATVHVRYLGDGDDDWSALVAETGPLHFYPAPFDHPLYVLFSSGTTGLPKAIVHGHGGITLEHTKSMALHHDLRAGDRVFWFTTTGWMMWNYLMSGLLTGSAIVLFDGDPGAPDLGTLWRLAAEANVDVFGVSAPFLMASRKARVVPPAHRIRCVGSTGAPLPAEGFRWVHDTVGPHVQVQSVSGGTDVCAAFVGAVPLLPVRAGEISCRLLGVAAEAFDPDGRPCPRGAQGELVVTRPMPSMPVGFWGDPTGEKLERAYFSDYPGVWRHGDWITFIDDDACVISGRSDATLNRGGVRLGTSDFYTVVEAVPEVTDSLVVHLESDDPDQLLGELMLFVTLVAGSTLDEGLRDALGRALRTQVSPRHVPDSMHHVPAVPRTLSGKRLEVPVKRILTGADADAVASRSSLVDPDALDWYERFAALRRSL